MEFVKIERIKLQQITDRLIKIDPELIEAVINVKSATVIELTEEEQIQDIKNQMNQLDIKLKQLKQE